MQDVTSGQKLLQSLLYSEFHGSASTKSGIEKEKTAIESVQEFLQLNSKESGLHVGTRSIHFLLLALIDDNGLIEVKP